MSGKVITVSGLRGMGAELPPPSDGMPEYVRYGLIGVAGLVLGGMLGLSVGRQRACRRSSGRRR